MGFNSGIEEFKSHKWFEDFNWISPKKYKPIPPKINLGGYSDSDVEAIDRINFSRLITMEEEQLFKGFEYIRPEHLINNSEDKSISSDDNSEYPTPTESNCSHINDHVSSKCLTYKQANAVSSLFSHSQWKQVMPL